MTHSAARVYGLLRPIVKTNFVVIRQKILKKIAVPGVGDAVETPGMAQDRSLSDQLEERMIEFAARIISFTTDLDKSFAGRHIAQQILRSGTSAAPNYAEARGAESRADFIHKLGIVQKELNETSVWLRILYRVNPGTDDRQVALLQENVELARIIAASIKTAKARMRAPQNDN